MSQVPWRKKPEKVKRERVEGREIDAEEFPVDGCQQLKGCYLTPGHGNTGALKTRNEHSIEEEKHVEKQRKKSRRVRSDSQIPSLV